MNLRTIVMVCGLSLSVAHMHAMPKLPSMQDIDHLAGRAVNGLAGLVDRLGAQLNLCRPPIGQAVSAAGEHLSNLNIGAASDALTDGIKQSVNTDLPYAPVTTFIGDHLKEAKIAFSVVVALATGFVIKRVFFPKKSKKN